MKLILVRHCQTNWNIERRLQGHQDIKLNGNGVKQASVLGKKLRSDCGGIRRIVSSDLRRASQTSYIIAIHLNVSVHLDSRLRECGLGILEGMTWPEIEDMLGVKKSELFQSGASDYDFTLYGGENRKQVLERHLEIVYQLKGVFEKETILIVGHSTSLNTLLAHLGKEPNLKTEEYETLEI